MFLLFIFAFLIHGVFSTTSCKDGVEIISQETKNPEDLIGTWHYVYYWDPKIKVFEAYLLNDVKKFECPKMYIKPITPELVKAKEAECAKYKMPFNWADAKLRLDAPDDNKTGYIIIIGEKANWMAADCNKKTRVVFKKISDDYTVMVYPDKQSDSELIARESPSLDELKCVSDNLDVTKGMSGFALCYKE